MNKLANKENLKPLSTDKAREIGKKGGIASGESRRKRKAMKEQLETILSMPVTLKDENGNKLIDKYPSQKIKRKNPSKKIKSILKMIQHQHQLIMKKKKI